ncbi:MAG: ATP-binding protein [Magnetococcus sp. YQC-5]
MTLSDFLSQGGVLLRQAIIRVVVITLVMVVTLALLILGFQHAAMDKSSQQVMTSLERFYNEKIILWEQEWQEQAIILHNRLELLNLFGKEGLTQEGLYLDLDKEVGNTFSMMLITDANQEVVYKYSQNSIILPERFVTTNQTGWFEEQASGVIYHWIAQPLWLGSRGNGELVLFVAIENGLLFRNTLPYTDLFLLHNDHIHASSLGNTSLGVEALQEGTFWHGNDRLDQISVPWGTLSDHVTRLVIRHHSEPFFSVKEIFFASITMFALLSLIFWQTLGVWLLRLTRRISTLGWVAREFCQGYRLTPAIRQALEALRHPGYDEVAVVADAMVNAEESVEKELAARKLVQIHLQRISTHNQLLLEAAGEGIYGLDPQGCTTFMNPAGARMLGWNPKDLIGRDIHEIIHHTRPDHTPYPRSECPIHAAIKNATIQRFDDELFWRKDGTSFPVEYTSTPIVDDDMTLGAVVVFRDISERIAAEKQAGHYVTYQRIVNGLYEISYLRIPLREQLEQALGFILSVPWLALQAKGAVFLADSGSTVLSLMAHNGLDPALVTLCKQIPYGHCLCGRAAQEKRIIHAHDVDERHDISFAGMKPHGHYSVPMLSGEYLLGVLTLYLQPGQIRNREEESLIQAIGNTLGSMIERKNLEDSLYKQNLVLEEKVSERTAELNAHLTSLKLAQDQLIQSERLAALGGLVAGISHEINTPVGSSYTAVTYLETETNKFHLTYQAGNLRREALDHFLANVIEATHLIKANLKRASDLILAFKQVSVDQISQEKRAFNVREYLEEIVFTLRPQLKTTHHQVIIECPARIELNSYPGALSQIISNLVMNSLSYAFGPEQHGTMRIHAGLLNRETVFLHYQDNGKGMDKETLKQIYEPFFTTNRNLGGSGLGMHIVYNLVTQRLHGTIEAYSTPGQGTEFRIQFPV